MTLPRILADTVSRISGLSPHLQHLRPALPAACGRGHGAALAAPLSPERESPARLVSYARTPPQQPAQCRLARLPPAPDPAPRLVRTPQAVEFGKRVRRPVLPAG